MNIVYQVIGFAGTGFMVVSYQQRKRENILRCHMCAGAAFALHYFLIGAYSGAISNLLSIGRSFVYSNRDKKWANSLIWPAFFEVLFFVSGALTWEGPISLLTMTAMALTSISLWIKDTRKVRLLTFPSSPMWLAYNIYNRSFACTLTEAFILISMIVAIVRYDILKIPEKAAAEKSAIETENANV